MVAGKGAKKERTMGVVAQVKLGGATGAARQYPPRHMKLAVQYRWVVWVILALARGSERHGTFCSNRR